jgi:hypothetical protein
MNDQWYYSRDTAKIGPMSSLQLKGLADAGTVLRTDTVFKHGFVKGVAALKVKHLFADWVAAAPKMAAPVSEFPALTPLPGIYGETAAVEEPAVEAAAVAVAVIEAPVEKPKPAVRPMPARKATATAGRGAVIVGQDGTVVRFKKRCTKCSHEDTSWTTMRIVNGMMTSSFFCPNCKKKRDVEVRGSVK